MSGLPYERTPSPGPSTTAASANPLASLLSKVSTTAQEQAPAKSADIDIDRPLDDIVVEAANANASVIPRHVQDLMSRMGKGKLYMLDESPGILHVDSGERIRGDPRIAALSAQLNDQDPTAWLLAASSLSLSPIRPTTLFVTSENIQHLSTSKVFSWVTGLGASAMGIEWLNDTTLLLVFPSAKESLIGLSLLSKAGFDPAEGDDPLLERAAHSMPISLLPVAEPKYDPELSQAGTELLSSEPPVGDDPSVRKKGRGAFASSTLADRENRYENLIKVNKDGETGGWGLADGVDPNARIGVRYAVNSDGGLRAQAKQSAWYKRHGFDAGKEVSSGPRRSERYEDEQLSFRGRDSTEGRDFAKRIGKNRRAEPYGRPRQEKKTADDLDAELERIARGRAGEDVGGDEMDVDMDRRRGGRSSRGRNGGNNNRRERVGADDLDKELDNMFAERTAAAT